MALNDEQKRLRAEAYGSSEVATIVGRGPGRKRIVNLWEQKTRGRFPEEDIDDMLPAELGTLEEEPVAAVYARKTGTLLHTVQSLKHPTRPLAVATPDRARFLSEGDWARAWERAKQKTDDTSRAMLDRDDLDGADRLVEVKTHAMRYRDDYGEPGSGVVPEHEAIQVTWQLGVTGLKVADLAVLFRGDWGVKFHVFTVNFNEDLFEWLYERVEKFHRDHVLARVPPPPDGSDEYSDALGRFHSAACKTFRVPTEEEERLMLRYAMFNEVERRAGKYKTLVGQELANRIGADGGLDSPTLGKLSWISVSPSVTTDWHKAAENALQLGGLVLNGLRRLRAEEAIASDASIAEFEARLRAIVPEAAKPKNGYRYLKLTPKGDAKLELPRLNVALDALDEK